MKASPSNEEQEGLISLLLVNTGYASLASATGKE